MNDQPKSLIAHTICYERWGDDGEMHNVGTWDENTASAVLDALAEARYAVVKLPKPIAIPTSWRGECIGAWRVGKDKNEDPVSAWADDGFAPIALPDGSFITVAAARNLAGALLAAVAKVSKK